MIEKIQALFNKFQFRNTDINLYQELEKVIDQVENKLTEEKQNREDDILFITELLQLKRLDDLEKLNNDTDFKKVREDLISHLNFVEDFEQFIYNKPIEIESVRYLDESGVCISKLNKDQEEYINQEGYRIYQVRIPKFKKIKYVNCNGKHSNINPKTSEYCVGGILFDSDLNYDNVDCLLQSMKVIALNDSYMKYNDICRLYDMKD